MNTLKKDFICPGHEFAPIPFWFWNDELSKKDLKQQLDDLYKKGIRSFVIHPRKGLPESNRYLSDSFLDYVEFIVREASKLEMTVFLYDEAMYPSGAANGKVVATNPQFAAKGLQMSIFNVHDSLPVFGIGNWFVSSVVAEEQNNDSISYTSFDSLEEAITYSKNLDHPHVIYYFTLVYSEGTIRGVHEGEDDGEPNAPKAADLLDPDAVELFIHLTHDVYFRRLKDYFGTTIISMFTDEPSILGRFPKKGLIPWTHGFLENYLACGGRKDDLPFLFDKTSEHAKIHQIYQHAVNLRMRECYFKPLSNWCQTHNIMLSGHPHSSDDIGFLEYFQLPCQDLVWRFIDPDIENGLIGHHSTMGKCSSDSARHRGKRRNGNECFGACGRSSNPWDFTSDDMKWYLDWLFVRGVNLIIPHAFYYSLRDDRVNERPPDVGPNSIWWDYYEQIVDYIKRMCWLMTDSHNITDIAVLCTEDHLPWEPVQELYRNQLEFNYLEADLLKHCQLTEDCLKIANQSYKIILVEDGLYLSKNQQDILNKISAKGIPVMNFSDLELSQLKDTYNSLALKTSHFVKDLRISHVVKDNIHFYLLVNEGKTDLHFHTAIPLKGKKELWDPWHGNISNLPDDDFIPIKLGYRESIIIAVTPQNHLTFPMKYQQQISERKNIYAAEITVFEDADFNKISIQHTGEIVTLFVDDRLIGTCMWKPYTFSLENSLTKGSHLLRAEITDSMVNKTKPQVPLLTLS